FQITSLAHSRLALSSSSSSSSSSLSLSLSSTSFHLLLLLLVENSLEVEYIDSSLEICQREDINGIMTSSRTSLFEDHHGFRMCEVKMLKRGRSLLPWMLYQLVWSPRNGLRIFTGKKAKLPSPSVFDDIALTNTTTWSLIPKAIVSNTKKKKLVTVIGGSVENTKPEREEMGEDKVETNDDSEEAETRVGASKRSLDSPRGETEALLANEELRLERAGSQEEPTNLGDNRADRVEATDENDLPSPASKACERLAKAKGKEKALYDGNFNDDESFGSKVATVLVWSQGEERKEQVNFEAQHDSSFMNWISNMTKGIWKGNEEDNSPLPLTTTTSDANGQVNAIVDQPEMSGCRNTGFQSFFQSIYCQKKSDQDAVEVGNANVASLQELPERCLITRGDHVSSSGNGVAPVSEPDISSEKLELTRQVKRSLQRRNRTTKRQTSLCCLLSKQSEKQKTCCEGDEKDVQCLTNKNSGLQSLWISRFSSKSSLPQKQDLRERIITKEANDSSSDAVKIGDPPQNNAILPIVSSLRVESSEAMASLFARRLEAMKHMLPTCSLAENTEGRDGILICFYCGKKVIGYRNRSSPNISARNGREEASTLCIRSKSLGCNMPNAPPYSSAPEDRSVKHYLASTSGPKLPFRGFTDVPKAVFEAVQVLRLTRTDVLKWINSKKSVSGLEGFFLRLRLGKWAEGLGGTGYHVARIEGATEGQSSKEHPVNSSVSVKVGGMTCFVESQFISNHDFVEEELLAWWRSAAKRAGKSGVDDTLMAEELSRKIQQRKMFYIYLYVYLLGWWRNFLVDGNGTIREFPIDEKSRLLTETGRLPCI
ncbi:LOW QUALITY PROTEIN: hypothetical protein HID58_078940, partial [Brassica napus]